MAQIEVGVFRKGREVTRVIRPVRHVEGQAVVKYKRQFWPLINGGQIYLDKIPPQNELKKEAFMGTNGNEGAPKFEIVPPSLIEWDSFQKVVIDAPQEHRLMVDAGPGTGKTAVACARISKLIDQDGLEPSRIWLISFTRTAVREVRDRIAAHLEDAAAAYAVKIATLDSHAWTIHSGFDDEARILGSYEENIEKVLELVRENEGVAEYIDGIEHLVVDEAQDIVGIRSELVMEVVHKLPSVCGVTVFADEAQAIYDFADNGEVQSGESRKLSLPENVRRGAAGDFRSCGLIHVHRTGSSRLLTIFSDVRRRVLTTARETQDKLANIQDEISSLAHGQAPPVDKKALAELEDAFILYRRRCDVLLASSILTKNGIAHRVRMSGLPICLAPWVGATLSGHEESTLSRNRFMELWTEAVEGTSLATFAREDAWANLVRIAGITQTVVEMRRLRQRLGRKQPPMELCHAEIGVRGPIVGTIHASKGREADTVHLMLPRSHGPNVDHDEEARVVFVGATRGRSRLLIGQGYRQFANRVDTSGRAYCLQTKDAKPRAQFEIGHDNDIMVEGLASRRFFASVNLVRESQDRIRRFAGETVSLVAESDHSADFSYRLKEDGQGQCLAVLSRAVNADLFKIADALQQRLGGSKRRPPDKIRHIHMRGVRTVVLPPDSPEGEPLHEPWKNSGIMLAPLVMGYTTAYFPISKK